MPQGIIEVKLGRPLQMPQRRLFRLLEAARLDCCKACDAAIVHWYLWRRANPKWQPGDEYEPPVAKIKRKPSKNGKAPPKDSPLGPRLFLSRELYAAAVAAAPHLSGSVASSCVQEVIARLRAKMPYNHMGKARYQWQAMLSYECSVPSWRGGRIPIPTSGTLLGYDGAIPIADKPDKANVARAAEGGCVIRFPLLSKASGYQTISPIVRLEVGELPGGKKRIIRRLASGELRLGDSQIIEKDGKWFAQLCYEVEVLACGCPTERVMTLLPSLPDDRRPLTLQWTQDEDGEVRSWGIGNGLPLVAEYRRVVTRRRAIRYHSREGGGRGHGKQRFYRALEPTGHAVKHMQSRFEKQTVSDIVKRAVAEGCGTLLYREPTMPVRENAWFAKQDMPFGWAEFEARLKFKAECVGLDYSKTRIGMKEWLPEEKRKKPQRKRAG